MVQKLSKRRSKRGWSTGYIEWIDRKKSIVYMSVVFSWHLLYALQKADYYISCGYEVVVGGPAVNANPTFFPDRIQISLFSGCALEKHNPNATFTTRGCIRKCEFCIVPKIEGDLIELADDRWLPKSLICDNNLLAASIGHFDHVIDRLLHSKVEKIDFNQGLDARLLTQHHAEQLLKLYRSKKLLKVRLAWDDVAMEKVFRKAYSILREVGIPKNKISVYVLIGFDDTPADALYRLQEIQHLKAIPNPMRYQPLDILHKNNYVAPNWTDAELKKYMRYWSNLRYVSKVPFNEFRNIK